MVGQANLPSSKDPLDQQQTKIPKPSDLSSSNNTSPTGLAGGSGGGGGVVPTLVLPNQQELQQQQQQQPKNDEQMIPQFESALPYTQVRDFAYPEFHPLHYGVAQQQSSRSQSPETNEQLDSYNDDGPPWQQDEDLASPVVKSHEVGDRISREYEFSVSSIDEVHGRAVALFDFLPENENEAPLREGQIIWVSYRHGQGWLVAEVDPETGEAGLVPEEYVEMIPPEEARRLQEIDRQRMYEEEQYSNNNDSNSSSNSSNYHDAVTEPAAPPPPTTSASEWQHPPSAPQSEETKDDDTLKSLSGLNLDR